MQEEGFAQAQRVLLNDVSGDAVHVLLQYLYTAVCQLTPSVLPDVLQLASRSVWFHGDVAPITYTVKF